MFTTELPHLASLPIAVRCCCMLVPVVSLLAYLAFDTGVAEET